MKRRHTRSFAANDCQRSFNGRRPRATGRSLFTGPIMPWGALSEPTTHRANFKTDGTVPVDEL